MKWWGLGTLGLFFSVSLGAQNKDSLSLNQFLEQVKSQNPEARATIENITAMQLRGREADVPLVAEAYAHYGLGDDKKQTAQPIFMGSETRVTQYRAGVRKQTEYGLGADFFVNAQRTVINGALPQFLPEPDMMESSANLQLTQSLWRNGFGEGTRAQVEMNRASTELALLRYQFTLKNLLLSAQNAYWSLVSYNQIVKLQEENVERAMKLRDYMAQRERMRLFDDTDAMQAQASFESRELELQSSLDDRAMLIRQFNTLRGLDSDALQELDDLPAGDIMVEVSHAPKAGHMSREDFEMLRAQAKAGLAQAKGAASQIQPQFDVSASFSTNGRDGITQRSYEIAETSRYPTWAVGVTFSVPLDFGLVRDLKHSYKAAGVASEGLNAQAQFSETRAWEDLVKQKKEAQGRYERSLSVEKIQTELVKRERQRLLNGRATTFEAINFEQTLALSQIQRVRAQLALLQIHNAIKTFEARQ